MRDSWTTIKLDELGRHYGGLTNKSKDNFGKGKPYIPYLNIFLNSKIDKNNLELVEIFPSESQNKVRKGDLFFTTSSETPHEVGMTSVLLDDLGEAYLNSFCFGFRLNDFDTLLPEFAVYLFRGKEVRKTIADLAQGSTRYNLSKSIFFDKLYFNLPPLPQQQKIAKILSTVDTVIEKTESAIAKYQAIKQGLMQDLFTRGIDVNTGLLRPKQQDAPELYKESALGWIPREWEVEELGNIGDFKNGVNKDKESFGSGTPFVNISDAYPEVLDTSKLSKVEVTSLEKSIYKLDKGDIIFVRSSVKPSGVGYTTLYEEESHTIIYCGFMIRFRLVDKINHNPLFYNNYFRYEDFRRRLLCVSTVSANTNVNQESLKKLLCIKPSKEEQIETNLKLISITNKIQTEQQALSKYQQLKAGLMQDLLSGKVEVGVD